ncbi:MAG TPA: tetratricopeptide repeat protein, partial [Thermodesulfobacteriota bacterium]|nr:tetratricopeptide repeat protein [Thermodesulfobacteriota bacterium]
MVASLQLTEQGKMLLDRNKPDDAIAVFERAIQLNPGSGQNYFYVAEAWIMKGTMDQAREF